MNLILLSGGSGKRLWPLSNDIRSKQFLKLFKNKDGKYESMVQRIYNQILSVDKDANITIATSKNQVPQIKNQLNDNVGISIEPCRKDTFPAIALAVCYLHDVKNIDENQSVVICPVDPYVEKNYFEALSKLQKLSDEENYNMMLMGINPTYPSEKFGYIIPNNEDNVSKVLTFKEKPNKELAESYIKQNALWNGGVFAFKIGYLLNKAHELIEFTDYYDLFNKYETLNKISFDYAVVENENNIGVMRFNGKWEDLGTYNTLIDKLDSNIIGNAIIDENHNSVNIINELDIPIVCLGLNNVVVSASLDGILVSNKESCEDIKKYVDSIDTTPRYIENNWGNEKIIDSDKSNEISKIEIEEDKKFILKNENANNYTLVILSGDGNYYVDNVEKKVQRGMILNILENQECIIKSKNKIKLLKIKTK